MKYFKPEIFRRSNSQAIEEALAAGDEWELALKAYRRRLKSIRPKLPEPVCEFIDTLYLHDSEILGITTPQFPPLIPGSMFAHLFVRQSGGVVVLMYRLLHEPTVEQSDLPHSLRSKTPFWLYDEVDLVDSTGFSHEIFASNGCLIKILFDEFSFHQYDFSFPMPATSAIRDSGDTLIAI